MYQQFRAVFLKHVWPRKSTLFPIIVYTSTITNISVALVWFVASCGLVDGCTDQNTNMDIVTTVRTSNLKKNYEHGGIAKF
jgi:hypothetical protein